MVGDMKLPAAENRTARNAQKSKCNRGFFLIEMVDKKNSRRVALGIHMKYFEEIFGATFFVVQTREYLVWD